MRKEGLETLFPARELSVIGLLEIIPHLVHLLKRLTQTKQDILAQKPDLVLTIDSPGFNFRLVRQLRESENVPPLPCVHYTAPSVWAWRGERAQKISRLYDHLFALFSFEPPYFERAHLPCTFVGHPLIEEDWSHRDPLKFRHDHGIAPDTPLVCLLPGSRRSEVERLLPPFAQALFLVQKKWPHLMIVCPTLPEFEEKIQRAFKGRIPLLFTHGSQEKYQAMAASQGALAASGTVSLELALTNTPMVIGYRLNPLTYTIVKRLVTIPSACLVNILLDAPVVPEMLQKDCTPQKLAHALLPLLEKPDQARKDQRLGDIESLLTNPLGRPSDLVAHTLLKMIDKTP